MKNQDVNNDQSFPVRNKEDRDQIRDVLITGGAGFVGTHLARHLVGQGYRVTSLDLKDPRSAVPGVRYAKGDVRDPQWNELIQSTQWLFHLAATVSVPLCQEQPEESYSNNVMATVRLLQLLSKVSRPIPFVFASTAALYGTQGDDGRELNEDDTPQEFLSFYAAQKHASEKAISLFAAQRGLPAFVFRFFNIFGPLQDPKSPYSGVITLFSHAARQGQPLKLNDGGWHTRDFVSVYDIAETLAKTLVVDRRWADAKPVNLASGRATKISELAEMIQKAQKSDSKLVSVGPREGDVHHSRADIRRARQRYGLEPRTNLQELLASVCQES